MTNIVATNKIEQALIQNNLSQLSDQERLTFYKETCESLGLNHLTQPFGYIQLNGKLCLYAKKDATDQLRKLHNVSVIITSRTKEDGIYSVTARARLPDGREDESLGSVNITNLKGDMLANAYMKAETKAKRRVTLSICGLGMLDETETDTIHDAKVVSALTPPMASTNNVKPQALVQPPEEPSSEIEKPIINKVPITEMPSVDSYKTNFSFGNFKRGMSFNDLGQNQTKSLQTAIMQYCLKLDAESREVPEQLKVFIELSKKYLERFS